MSKGPKPTRRPHRGSSPEDARESTSSHAVQKGSERQTAERKAPEQAPAPIVPSPPRKRWPLLIVAVVLYTASVLFLFYMAMWG